MALIQARLNAPKNLINKFGGYSYRNVEGIYEALKPLLVEYSLALSITDEIIEKGDRVYIEAVASLTDGTNSISVKGYAREAGLKKGMDEAQLTGSCSSYARKYALGGLFLIDDSKDIDSMDEQPQQAKLTPAKQAPQRQPAPTINEAPKKMLVAFEKIGIQENDVVGYLGYSSISEINKNDMETLREYYKSIKYAAEVF